MVISRQPDELDALFTKALKTQAVRVHTRHRLLQNAHVCRRALHSRLYRYFDQTALVPQPTVLPVNAYLLIPSDIHL